MSTSPATRSARPISVLLPLAVDTAYSYLPGDVGGLKPGDVVEVPLGPRRRLGVVWDEVADEALDPAKLRDVIAKLDTPPLPGEVLRFADWVARYTMIPRGMVLRMVLRVPEALGEEKPQAGVRLAGAQPQRMTAARARVLEVAADGLAWRKRDLADQAGVSPGVIDGLVDAGTLASVVLPRPQRYGALDPAHGLPTLSADQQAAAEQLGANLRQGGFSVALLDGVTGSGKTEVYFEAVAEALRQGRQTLVLLPEIALTGQFLERFEARFGARPAEWHSDLTPRQRETCWRAVHRGEARVVVGARSALFLPFPELGLIVVDEEHDPAYKQEERGNYHARDMAVARAHLAGFAVVLSSATPSIESRVNADTGRYQRLTLADRFGGARLPSVCAIDLRRHPPPRGRWLSPVLVEAVEQTLARGDQALLFLNRRGYAPLTLCRACGHRMTCPQCTAWLVQHRFRGQLNCHHCGFSMPEPAACPSCGREGEMVACGPGVERVAEEVSDVFQSARATILSSDLIASTAEMRGRLADIAAGAFDIVIGTQLIAKGHHFPGLALVGVVDADLGLGNGDLRAAERTYQLLHQVVGRAGRANSEGTGLLQTHMPEHPVIDALVQGDDELFFAEEIAARERLGYPPFGRLAAMIVSGKDRGGAESYARRLARLAPSDSRISILGPAEAPIAVLRGQHRFRLLVKAPRHLDLQAYLRGWLAAAGDPKGGVRLSVDIDPQSFM